MACDAVGITSRTYRNWRKAPDGDRRLDRKNFTSPRRINDEMRQIIVERYCQPDVVDLSLTQAFYKLLDDNQEYYCSLSTLYRIFREQGLNAKRAPTRDACIRSKPTSYCAHKANEVWTWDITYFRTSQYTGRFYYAYVIVDVYSRAIIKAAVYDADNSRYAAQFLQDAIEEQGIAPGQLVVHSDNGASMKAVTTLSVLKRNGVIFSHSRPRVSNDNPYSESLFRTLKYNGEYRYPAMGFPDLENAEQWLQGFVEYYNEHHRHNGIKMVTPGSRFRGEDKEILNRRKQTMLKAHIKYPQRWISSKILDCSFIKGAWLNPDNGMLEGRDESTQTA